MRRTRRLLSVGIIASCLTATLYLQSSSILGAVGRWLNVGERPKKVDWILVMPGGETTRPFVAAGMIRRQLAQGVLIPTNPLSPAEQDGIMPRNSQIIRAVLVRRGVQESQIISLDVDSDSTWTDAQALSRFLEGRCAARVGVITNDFHSRRARWVFHRVLGDRSSQLSFISAPVDEFGPENWWHSEFGLNAYASEYCKFMFYLFRYGDLLAWSCSAALITVSVVLAVRLRRRDTTALVL